MLNLKEGPNHSNHGKAEQAREKTYINIYL